MFRILLPLAIVVACGTPTPPHLCEAYAEAVDACHHRAFGANATAQDREAVCRHHDELSAAEIGAHDAHIKCLTKAWTEARCSAEGGIVVDASDCYP